MDSDDFKEMRERSRLNKKEREIINTHAITKWCTDNGISFANITSYQIRIATSGKRMDIFPQSKKYHNITDNKRGIITGKIIDFLTKNFL